MPTPEQAAQDLQTLEDAMNGAADRANPGEAPGTVTSRLGRVYPTWAKLMSTAAEALVVSGYTLFPVGHPVALDRILSATVLNGDPSKYYYVSRFYYHDVGTRLRFTVTKANSSGGAGAVELFDVALDVTYNGRMVVTFPATDGSAEVLNLVVNFGDGTTAFTMYTGTYATAAIPVGAVQTAPVVGGQVEGALTTEARRDNGCFSPLVRTPYLRDMFEQIWFYNAIEGHQYGVTGIEHFATGSPGSGGPYVRVFMRDLTANTAAVQLTVFAPTAMTRAEFVTWLNANVRQTLLTDVVSGQLGYYAHTVMKWDSLLTLPYGVNETATYALGGIAPERTYTDDDIADYLQRDHYHERFTVGAGGDFADLPAARTALSNEAAGAVVSNAVNRSHRAHYHNRVVLDLINQPSAATAPFADYLQTYWVAPDFVEVRGQGRTRTRLRRAALTGTSADAHEVTAFHLNHKVFDVQILSETDPQYPLHSDAVGATCDTQNGVKQRRRLRQKYTRMDLVMGAGHSGVGFGCGISPGQTIWFVDCKSWHENTQIVFGPSVRPADFFFHNTGPTVSTPGLPTSVLPAWVIMDDCGSMTDTPHSVYLMTLEPSGLCNLVLGNCSYSMVEHDTASNGEVVTDLARDRVQWVITGKHDGAIKYRDLDGAWVLQTTPGVAVTGSAAALIFGAVDNLGRGEKWIKNGTTKSLGARLGAGKTLTIGAQSITLGADQTARTNAAILADINAVLTANPITEANIYLERYPDVGYTRKVRNSSGVVIPKNRFVKRTAQGRVALAQPGDRIYGWTYRAIPNNSDGEVILTQKVAVEYIEGAAADGVELDPAGAPGVVTTTWGLAANGLLSYSAATKLGDTVGGVLTRW